MKAYFTKGDTIKVEFPPIKGIFGWKKKNETMGIVRDIVFKNDHRVDHYVVEANGQMYDVPAGEGYATISKAMELIDKDFFEEKNKDIENEEGMEK